MDPPASERLEIIWRGHLVPGVTFYALCRRGRRCPQGFPEEFWPAGLEVGGSTLHNEKWQVTVWDVAIPEWPRGDDWKRPVRATFQNLLDQGAIVAWIGSEGYFCDPPDLFDPGLMSGGVLAAMTADGNFLCPLDPACR